MNIFDIIGPIMVGPSSSHTAGAVKIGQMVRALLDAQPKQAEIWLHGSFAETGKDFNGWGNVWKTTDGDNGITFKVTCKNLGILFWRSTSKEFGNYEVWVDGEHVRTLQGEFPGGWGNYAHAQEVFVSDEEAEHTITIKKAEGSTGDDFVVLRLMISH